MMKYIVIAILALGLFNYTYADTTDLHNNVDSLAIDEYEQSLFDDYDESQQILEHRRHEIDASTEMATPYHAVKNHLIYLSRDNYKPQLSVRSFNFDRNISPDKRVELAIKLKRIFNGAGLIIRTDDISRDANYIDSNLFTHTYILFPQYPEIYLEKVNKRWLYSRETIDIIESLHDELYPFAIDEYLDKLPAWFSEKYLGLQVWQMIGILVFIALGLVLFYIFSSITGKFIIYLINRFNKKYIGDIFIGEAAKPSSFLFVCLLVIKFLPVLELPVGMNVFLLYVLKIMVPINVVYILMKLINLLSYIFSRLAEKTESKVDDHIVPFARKALKGIVFILGCFYILQIFNIDITPLIAGVSIGGLAFALAAQDTVKNVFGSFTIFTDQPFNVGDWIVFDGGEGTVEEVGTRSTRIRTFANSLITIPNGRLGDMTINNMGRRRMRRFATDIRITYNTPPDLIEKFIEGIKDIINNHPDTFKDTFFVYMNSFGSSSLNIMLYLFFVVPDWNAELKARHEIIMSIIRLAEEMGVSFAFPTQTLHIEDVPPIRFDNENLSDKYLNLK